MARKTRRWISRNSGYGLRGACVQEGCTRRKGVQKLRALKCRLDARGSHRQLEQPGPHRVVDCICQHCAHVDDRWLATSRCRHFRVVDQNRFNPGKPRKAWYLIAIEIAAKNL